MFRLRSEVRFALLTAPLNMTGSFSSNIRAAPSLVMLSAAGVQRSGTPAESKHPYLTFKPRHGNKIVTT